MLYNWILFGYYHHLKANSLYMSRRASCFLVLKGSKTIEIYTTLSMIMIPQQSARNFTFLSSWHLRITSEKSQNCHEFPSSSTRIVSVSLQMLFIFKSDSSEQTMFSFNSVGLCEREQSSMTSFHNTCLSYIANDRTTIIHLRVKRKSNKSQITWAY